MIHSLCLSHEHNLELLAIWIVVDVLSESLVNGVIFDGDVDGDARFQVDDVLSELVDLLLSVAHFRLLFFHLLEHLKLDVLGLVKLFF